MIPCCKVQYGITQPYLLTFFTYLYLYNLHNTPRIALNVNRREPEFISVRLHDSIQEENFHYLVFDL